MSTPDRESYTVGWICAVQTEYVAAQCFLDERHGKPESVHTNDNNHYTLGRIAGHNVVIAILPSGEYGISSATAVIKDMLHTFPNIRIGLMVGIGGGATTPKHDIRLGDIVVGAPRDGNGGVLQYDFGKMNQTLDQNEGQNQDQGQSFQCTGFLNQPPPILRTALAGLASRHEIDGHELDKAISDVLDRKPKLRKKYRRPDPSCDRLYKSEVIHSSKDEGCLATCGDDQSKLVSRPERSEEEEEGNNPAIHYGLIASANQLMKNAIIRDRLAKENNILCFEMEAAGLMNQFPCLVIRGICDYSDSHKNKEWQGYAAMAAAAYAKDLLCEVVPAKVAAERKITEVPGVLSSIERNVNEMRTNVQDTSDDVKSIARKMKSEKIDRWLSAPDPSTNYHKGLERRHEGSGTWFLKSKQFDEWRTSQKSSLLWLHGIPGCGKTILSSTIIERLESDPACQPLLYFYFDFTDTGKQTLENMLRVLISQLHHKLRDPSVQLESLYSSCADGRQQPTCRSLCETLSRMVEQAKEVWIILDALDECRTRGGSSTEGLLPWMSGILNSKQNIHLLTTSRLENDIKSEIENFTRIGSTEANHTAWPPDHIIPIQSSLISDDINAYIRMRVRQEESGLKRWRSHPEIQSEIEACLIGKANGMFRWAACQLDALKNCLEYRSLQKTLQSLPATLDETYARILRGIPQEHKQSAMRILQFLTYSARPLAIEEAIDAIAVDTEGDEYFNPKYRMPDRDEILCYCSSLVVAVSVEKDWRIGGGTYTELQLAHFSVKEYLTSDRLDNDINRHFQEIVAKGSIATVCLAYLLHLDHDVSTDELRNAYPLAQYCAQYWTDFATFAETKDDRLRIFIRKFFRGSHENPYRNCYSLYRPDDDGRDSFIHPYRSQPAPPLYYASLGGLLDPVKDLLDHGADVNAQAQNGTHCNALQAASAKGHEKITKLLLDHGADVNAQTKVASYYGSALRAASTEGHEGITKLLLDHGADVNAQTKGRGYDSALQAASAEGHAGITELLLNHGADVNARTPDEFELYSGALQAASNHGRERIIELLLNHGADVNAQGGFHGSALQAASVKGYERIVELLLNHGADVNAKGGYNGNALQAASVKGCERIIELLLNHGADVNAKCGFHGSALQAASVKGYERIVELLLNHGAGVNAQGGYYGNALQAASFSDHERIVELLLSHGADINAVGGLYDSALHAASRNGHSGVVNLLVSRGAYDPDNSDDSSESDADAKRRVSPAAEERSNSQSKRQRLEFTE
ncbi:hypothetical protein TWF481_006390 [Arthrobotrys musiformis]|uniref:NACHT domain-containing protein n=1 Tax=Arthrobotrys musiformis TaxID=47236 RepID=A0AAV9WII8_9PEZI